MFHITFVQIGVFDWLSGRQKASIFIKMFKNLLRNHIEDEAETWHTFKVKVTEPFFLYFCLKMGNCYNIY